MLTVNFVGRIGTVRVARSKNGQPIVELSVATDGMYVQNGERDTRWVTVIAYGPEAQSMLALIEPANGGTKDPSRTGGLIKGALIEGSAVFNRLDRYTGKDGAKHEEPRFLLTSWGFVRVGTGQGQKTQMQQAPQTQAPQYGGYQAPAGQYARPQAPQYGGYTSQAPVQQPAQQPQAPQPAMPEPAGYQQPAPQAPAGQYAAPAPDDNPFAGLGM